MNGYVLTKSDVRTNLVNRGAYKSALDALEQTRRSSLDYLGKESEIEAGSAYNQYADTIEQAYASAQKSRNALLGSNITSGYKQELSGDIDTQLDDIYRQASDAYKKNIQNISENYLKNALSVEENYESGVKGVESSIEEHASNFERYWQSYLNYYDQYLRDNLSYESIQQILSEDRPDQRVETYLDNWFTEDEEGNKVLKDTDSLLASITNRDESTGKLVSTQDTIDFIRMLSDLDKNKLLSRSIGSEYQSFSDWLRNEDEELYDWVVSDQGIGFGSGEDLFRELSEVPSERTFDSYRKTEEYEKSDKVKNSGFISGERVTGNVGVNKGKWNNFDVTVGDVSYGLETGKVADSETSKTLNTITYDNTSKNPVKGDIVVYDDTVYVYAKDNKWRVVNRRDDGPMSAFIASLAIENDPLLKNRQYSPDEHRKKAMNRITGRLPQQTADAYRSIFRK